MVNKSDTFTLKQKQIERYSDFATSFETNPFTGMLARVTNEESVKQALRNITLTDCGERFYDSNKGSKLKQSLFELFDLNAYDLAKIQLRSSYAAYEPRAVIHDIQFQPDALDYNEMRVSIIFSIINIPNINYTLELSISRVR